MDEYLMYLRKSRADLELEARGEGETLSRHEKALTDLAARMHLQVGAIYREVVSGETISDRPKMQKLLTEVMSGRWAGVIVMEIERLARGDTIDQGTVSMAFKISGTKIITPAKTYDPENEFDEEYFEFGLFMSRREYKTINRRIQRGRVASAQEGKFLGSTPPYGYQRIKIANGKGYTLEINPDEATVVQMIFDWYVHGVDGKLVGDFTIATMLDDMHIPTRSGSTTRPWSRASVYGILHNPAYIAKNRWGYRKVSKKYIDGKFKKYQSPCDSYIYVDAIWPAIISQELFDAAQKISCSRNHSPAPTASQNPLSGLVYCKKCGSLMTRLAPSNKTPYAALKCPNPKCTNISAPLYLVENKLIDALREWMIGYELSEDGIPVRKFPQISVLENNISRLQEDISGLAEQKNRAYDYLEQGVYTIEVFRNRLDFLEKKEDEARKAISELSVKLEEIRQAQTSCEEFLPAIKNIMDGYESISTPTARNQLLHKVLECVEYEKSEPNRRGHRENANFSLELYPKLKPIKS